MDIPRQKPPRNRRRLITGATALLALTGATVALGHLRAAPPTVEKASLWMDTVKRGPMLRQVKGAGTLVPEHIRWITADTAGRVERIEIRPGASVKEDTLLLELSNPDVMLQALEAERQLASAEAQLVSLKSTLETQRLAQESAIATLRSDTADALRRGAADQKLEQKAFLSEVEAKHSQDRAAELTSRLKLEQERLRVMNDTFGAQIAAQRTQIDRLKAVVEFRRKQVDSLHVRAGGEGLLQDLPLELGQWVTPGTLLAKVTQPGRLKAELKIPETQARDLQLGQRAEIDTRNGVVPGSVARIAPAASQGTVLVEVSLEGELPKGARPDLNVEGTIELERLSNVVYVGRPAGAQSGATMELFRVSPNDDTAERVKVKLGRSSVSTIEVVDGLKEGDAVILSDMSNWDRAERVRIK